MNRLLSREDVQSLVNDGLSHREIAERKGCSRSTVTTFVRREGITRTEALDDKGIPSVQCLPELIHFVDTNEVDVALAVECWREEESRRLFGVPAAITPELIECLIRTRKYRRGDAPQD